MTKKNTLVPYLTVLLSFILLCTSAQAQEAVNQNLFILKRAKNAKTSYEQIHLKGAAVSQLNIEKYLERHIDDFEIRIMGNRITELENQKFDFNSEILDRTDCKRFCKKKESEAKAFIGVKLEVSKGLDAAKIESIIPASSAEKTGLQQGDIITQIDGLFVHSPCDLNAIISEYYPGDRIKITYIREEHQEEKELILGARLSSTITWVPCCEPEKPTITTQTTDDSSTSLHIAPNPNEGFFQLTFELEADQAVIIRMTDNTGRAIYQETINKFNGFYHKEIDVSKAAAGLYYLNVIQKNKVISKKVVLQKL